MADDHYVMVVTHSDRPYTETMSLVAQAVREKLGDGVVVHGHDQVKEAAERQRVADERTQAITAYHHIDKKFKQQTEALRRILAGLESIASFECRCDADTADYSDDATEEDTACAACLAQIIHDREKNSEAQ